MLNISSTKANISVQEENYHSFAEISRARTGKLLAWWLYGFFILLLAIMFLPWTQNVSADGKVTSLMPDQRPQTLHSAIAGQVEKWYVREGQFVSKGDTLLHIAEVKDDYFDPQLLERTRSRIEAKSMGVDSYREKASALARQIQALRNNLQLKTEQARNKILQSELKVKSDSMDLEAAKIQLSISKRQLEGQQQLYEDGLKSLTDLEKRKLKYQEAISKEISARNKLLSSRNDLLNAQLELSSVENQYRDKLAKAESERYATLSSQYESTGEVAKMESQYTNYSIRFGKYYITAPQDGYITKAFVTGIGETIKEGEEILSLMPANYELAVEMFVNPMDLPLIRTGQQVRFVFDGWPSIVFSGWPGVSTGTFAGKVIARDNFASPNGKFRVLVSPDPSEVPWPEALRIGSGAKGMALLTDVPIWYEIWRNLNGFPPNFYEKGNDMTSPDTGYVKKEVK